MNLTSLLVLTTLFISVSSSLPQTAYVKMVDVWLIFAQVVPWLEVLLHTLIDWMRTDEEERRVNHHGKTITVGGGKKNEDKEMVKFKEVQKPLFSLLQIFTDGNLNRPGTGRASREAFANMTQVFSSSEKLNNLLRERVKKNS